MCTLYESIRSLCLERGITGGKMCVDLGLSKSLMTDLKAGRKKGITVETAQKIADYFSVSVDRVLGTEKVPISEDKLVDEPEIRAIQRAAKKMTPGDKKRMLAMLQLAFEDAFKDDENSES